MNLRFDDGETISLEQMLNAKEQRVELQSQYLDKYHQPLISLTLVIPGAIKNSSGSRYLFDEAIMAIERYFKRYKIPQIAFNQELFATGPEAIMVFNGQASELKKHCLTIEECHPLGRLWDIDVIDPISKISVSRTVFSQQPRVCLICQNSAKECGRSRAHSIDEILLTISHRVNQYKKLR